VGEGGAKRRMRRLLKYRFSRSENLPKDKKYYLSAKLDFAKKQGLFQIHVKQPLFILRYLFSL
jgi:hypothetical protein